MVARAVLRDPDSNPYSLLEGEGELADSDLSEGMGDRRRRSRRRRNDQEPSVMDAAAESDGQAGPNENGLGEAALWRWNAVTCTGGAGGVQNWLFFFF